VDRYYVWEDAGRLATRTADFRLAPSPADSLDRDLVPPFRGISDSPTLESWDPPFPVDLRRVRRVDEDYWKSFRTTPKAFVGLDVGQQLWGTRFGALTSVRFRVLEGKTVDATVDAFLSRLDDAIKPPAFGFTLADARAAAVSASQGATDFGEYFISASSSWWPRWCWRRCFQTWDRAKGA
jgi:hypothetical protein